MKKRSSRSDLQRRSSGFPSVVSEAARWLACRLPRGGMCYSGAAKPRYEWRRKSTTATASHPRRVWVSLRRQRHFTSREAAVYIC